MVSTSAFRSAKAVLFLINSDSITNIYNNQAVAI